EAMSRNAVMSQVQTNSGRRMNVMPGARMLKIVAMMLMAPMIEDTPMKWTAKITNGMASPVCRNSGGYMVQPPAGPPPGRNSVTSSRVKANGRIQKLQLFMRGSAMSGAPIIIGSSQLAKPTVPGMTTPKIMTSACIVVMELKNCGSTHCMPGSISSRRMIMAMAPPMKNITSDNSMYSVPMSLWLVVKSQRRQPVGCSSWCSWPCITASLMFLPSRISVRRMSLACLLRRLDVLRLDDIAGGIAECVALVGDDRREVRGAQLVAERGHGGARLA